MIRSILLALLSVGSLLAQKPGLMMKASAALVGSKDLLMRQGLSERFQGYLVSKKTGQIILFFDGTWVKAPAITGGGSGEWSGLCAEIRDMDDPASERPRVLSFNLGRKGDQWQVRTFKFALDPIYGRPVPATAEGQGSGTREGNTLRFELGALRLVLRGAEKGWEATAVRVFRFRATGFVPTDTPGPFAGSENGTRQYLPIWGTGSYAVLQGDRFGRLLYRPFGDASQVWMVRYALEKEKAVCELPRYYANGQRQDWANAELAGFFLNGLGNFKPATFGVGACKPLLLFKDPSRLDEVFYAGERVGFGAGASITSTLKGETVEVSIPDAQISAVLNRAKDPSWIVPSGPGSLRKLLDLPYQGCLLQWPMPSLNPNQGYEAERVNRLTMAALKEKALIWAAFAREAGVTISEKLVSVTTPVPMGIVFTKEELEKMPPLKDADGKKPTKP